MINVGDFVKGTIDSPYGITNQRMTKGVVTEANGDNIEVKIIDHDDDLGGKFIVESKYFKVIGNVKPFDRDTVIDLLKKGRKKALLDYDLSGADLSDANLSDANLSDANLDFSCYPLWCGSLGVKTDTRLPYQLAYHLCSMQCDDAEYIKMRNSILEFANKFHRVSECGMLKIIEEVKPDENATQTQNQA